MSNPVDRMYLALLDELLIDGVDRPDRTGVGRRSLFGRHFPVDLTQGFPLLTTKKLYTRAIVAELAWFLRGETNVAWLRQQGVTIWDEWADGAGELGPVYGAQWRSWPAPDGRGIDQVRRLIRGLLADPYGSRHIVNAWNVAALDDMALPPCHLLFQFFVEPRANHQPRGAELPPFLSCAVYQRSADAFLGLPFNIASYALLTHLVAREVGMVPHRLHMMLGDVHLYANHVDQARLQRGRAPRELPRVEIDPAARLLALEPEHVRFKGYHPHPRIAAEVAV